MSAVRGAWCGRKRPQPPALQPPFHPMALGLSPACIGTVPMAPRRACTTRTPAIKWTPLTDLVQGSCSSGNNNNCGTIYGATWSPDSSHIVIAHGRNDEGVYYWYADIDEDNDGYNTTDQGDGIVDAFPSKEPNGTTPMATALATTQPPLTNRMLVQPRQVRPPKTATVALMVMATVGRRRRLGSNQSRPVGRRGRRWIRRQLPLRLGRVPAPCESIRRRLPERSDAMERYRRRWLRGQLRKRFLGYLSSCYLARTSALISQPTRRFPA